MSSMERKKAHTLTIDLEIPGTRLAKMLALPYTFLQQVTRWAIVSYVEVRNIMTPRQVASKKLMCLISLYVLALGKPKLSFCH